MAGAALWTCPGRRSTLDVWCCVLLQIALSGLSQVVSGDNVQIPWHVWVIVRNYFAWQAHHLVKIRRVWNVILWRRRSISTLYTLHSALDTLHLTFYPSRFSPATLRFTLYTLHCKLHTLHSTLRTLHFTFYTSHSTPYTWHCALHFTLYTLRFTLHTVHSTLYAVHF